jgi:hypothetical protein
MKAHWLAGIVVVMFGAFAPSVTAHHSFSAQFDENQPLKLTGKLVEVKMVNPHSWIYIEVKGKDGTMERWAWETAGVNNLYRSGWKKSDLVIGTTLVIDGHRARSGGLVANASTITLENGRRLLAGSPLQSGGKK